MMKAQGEGNKVARGISNEQQKQQHASYSTSGNDNERMLPYRIVDVSSEDHIHPASQLEEQYTNISTCSR
jgi:hypothetical protein